MYYECLESFSIDHLLSQEFNHHSMNSNDLQPCIEDIRLEIDHLRHEEQLLRQKFA